MAAGAVAHNDFADALARGGQAGSAASSAEGCGWGGARLGSGWWGARWCGVDDRPAEPGEVAGDGGGDERFALAALGVEPPPDVVEALLGFPGDRDHGGGLVLLAVLERRADSRRAAVVPGGLDE